MLNDAGARLDMGPGSTLISNDITAERKEKREDKEQFAFDTIERLVQMTKGNITGQSPEDIELFEERVRTSVTKSMMDSSAGPTSLAWLAYPSEHKLPGSVLTQSFYGQGTTSDRHEMSERFGYLLNRQPRNIDGSPATDDLGRLVPNNMGLRKDLAEELKRNKLTGNKNSAELDAYFTNIASHKASYMPKPKDFNKWGYEEKQEWNQNRDVAWEDFSGDLKKTRRIIQRITQTTADESNGTGSRKSAFGRPQGEEEAGANAVNEAFLLDIEGEQYLTPADDLQATMGADRYKGLAAREIESFDGGYLGSGAPATMFVGPTVPEAILEERVQSNLDARSEMFSVGQVSGGSETGGMYGSNDVTDRSTFIDLAKSGLSTRESLEFLESGEMPEDYAEPTVYANTPHGRYQEMVDRTNPNEQGTDAWLDERVGYITASQASRLNGGAGQETMAIEMAEERLGAKKRFWKSPEMQRGNDLEDTARDKFLQMYADEYGKGVNFEEAYFETNPNLPGLGVSPDGRLYDDRGSSEGLLEIKVLTHEKLEGSRNEYYKQMQMQMMVTGETQTHFYAYDGDGSNDFAYEVVYADVEVQEELRINAELTHKMSDRMRTIEDVNISKEAREMAKRIKSKKPKARKSSTGQTEAFEVEQEMPMQAWRPGGKPVSAADTLVGPGITQDDVSRYERHERLQAEMEKESWDASDPAAPHIAAADRRGREEAEAAKAMKDLTNSVKETSESLKSFGSSAVNIGSELAGLTTGGNTTAMDTMRFAAKSGMTAEATRGLEFALMSGEGGMTLGGARENMAAMGKMQATFNDATKVEGAITGLATQWAGAGLDKSFGSMPSYSEIKGKDPQQLMAMVADMMAKTDDPEVRRQIDQVFGTNMSMSKLSGDEIRGAKIRIDEDGQREYYNGERWIAQKKQTLLEGVSSTLGEMGGAAAGALGIAAGVTGSATSKILMGSKPTGTMATKLAPIASKAGSVAKKIAGKAGPAAALSLAPMAIREFGDIEDDGGLADSGMDILEMAAWGAAAGSVVPGVGTLFGAGVGAAAGVATEAWQYFSSDDSGSVVPSQTINKPGAVVTGGQSGTAVSNNIDVTVNVDPDMVATNVDVDGESYEVTERGLQSGTA